MRNMDRECRIFGERCDELVSSRFILAEKRISELLKSLVLLPGLYRICENCLTDFNYETEFLRARTAGLSGRYRLSLPKEREKLVAFVFCLLSEIENKHRDLARLIEEYYDDNCVEGYERFCSEVIVPFRRAIEGMAAEASEPEPDSDGAGETDRESRERFFGEDFATIANSTIAELFDRCQTIAELVMDEKSFSDQDRQELQFLLEAFCHALMGRDRRLIRALFIGVKNAFRGYRKFHATVCDMERTLRDVWIV